MSIERRVTKVLNLTKKCYYYAPKIERDSLPAQDRTKLDPLIRQVSKEKTKVIAWFQEYLKKVMTPLTDVLAIAPPSGIKNSALQELKKAFEGAEKKLKDNQFVDFNELYLKVVAVEDEHRSNDSNKKAKEGDSDLYLGLVSQFLEKLEPRNFSQQIQALTQYSKQYQEIRENIAVKNKIKEILQAEFNRAIDTIKQEAVDANLSGNNLLGINILCNDIKVAKYREAKDGITTIINKTQSLENWENSGARHPFVEKVQVVHKAYWQDVQNIPGLIQKYSYPSSDQKIFFEETLPELPAFKSLMARIPIIAKRIEDNSDWQDKEKNEQKKSMLESLMNLVLNPETSGSSLEAVYRLMINKETKGYMTQSTRSDEGCFAFFRSTPESEGLVNEIIQQIEMNLPNFKKIKKQENPKVEPCSLLMFNE